MCCACSGLQAGVPLVARGGPRAVAAVGARYVANLKTGPILQALPSGCSSKKQAEEGATSLHVQDWVWIHDKVTMLCSGRQGSSPSFDRLRGSITACRGACAMPLIHVLYGILPALHNKDSEIAVSLRHYNSLYYFSKSLQ